MTSTLAHASLGCTCFNLRKLTRTVTRLYDQHLSRAGLTTTQFSLLQNVAREPLPLTELAARMSTERTTLTRNLKQLVDAGWIEIRPGEDPRQKIATLTETGRAVAREARKAWREAQTELEKTLGLKTVSELHQYLNSALTQLTPLLEERGQPEASEPACR